MDWLTTWGPVVVAAVVSVVMAAGFTWLFGWRNERQHRRGVRALVGLEIMHNRLAVERIKEFAEELLNTGDVDAIRRTLLASAKVSELSGWHRTRWDLPDVGVAFTYAELGKLTVWYYGLDSLTRAYEWLVSYAQATDLGITDEARANIVLLHVNALILRADSALDALPPIRELQSGFGPHA